MIDAKEKSQPEMKDVPTMTDLAEFQLALVGGGCGDVLWG